MFTTEVGTLEVHQLDVEKVDKVCELSPGWIPQTTESEIRLDTPGKVGREYLFPKQKKIIIFYNHAIVWKLLYFILAILLFFMKVKKL